MKWRRGRIVSNRSLGKQLSPLHDRLPPANRRPSGLIHLIKAGDRLYAAGQDRITAIEPQFMQMRELSMGSGRYITDHDMETAAAVVAEHTGLRKKQLYDFLLERKGD